MKVRAIKLLLALLPLGVSALPHSMPETRARSANKHEPACKRYLTVVPAVAAVLSVMNRRGRDLE